MARNLFSVYDLIGLASNAGRIGYSATRRATRALRRPRNPTRTQRMPSSTFTRSTNPVSVPLTAGEYSAVISPTLSMFQTTDVIGMFDQYKINWVEITVMPSFDPGQSGVTNNSQVFVAAACDPTGQTTGTPTISQITSFSGSKLQPLTAGSVFKYRFVPRAVNSLAAGAYAVNAADWLILSTNGATVPHQSLLLDIKTSNTLSVVKYDYVLTVNFSCKQVS